MVFGFALLCPRAARAWELWHGQSGHLPVSFFRGTGKAGIGKTAGRRAKPGTGTPISHHYIPLLPSLLPPLLSITYVLLYFSLEDF